jgi:hypothetical protein
VTVDGESPYRLLEPVKWRGLLARAAVFHATRAVLGRLCDLADQVVAVRVVVLQLSITAQELAGHCPDDTAMVGRVTAEWEAALDRTLALERLDSRARTLLTEVRRLLRHACCGDPFRTIFEGIEAQAHALYGEAWRPAALSVAHTRSHPRGADADPYGVTAATPWPPQPDRAEIELQIFCEEFGPAAFAAVPMLLTHECVCHVPARQDRAKNDSEFAEGLLDWAAYHFLNLWAVKLDPQLAPAARQHARRLEDVLTRQSRTREGMARRVGHDAAEALLVWFESDCGLSPEESRNRVAHLAVELNLVDCSLLRKDNFVSRLSWPLPPDLDKTLREWMVSRTPAAQLLADGAP